MLEYARWKYYLVAIVLLLALLFALPNFFGEDPALQVARKDHADITADASKEIESFLTQKHIAIAKSYLDSGRLMVRFASVPEQLAARDAVNENEQYKGTYITAFPSRRARPSSCVRSGCGRCRSAWTYAAASIFCIRWM